ncbi:MAG: nucleotide exchange factor GrpE [Leptospiraceae bacterium]|nr:nucleotide exchange factor GrpE [Leptospiraceae bacterium]MCB1314647.1 nucleotide exchange factor GrpE [Leptospiraceae bacterium]
MSEENKTQNPTAAGEDNPSGVDVAPGRERNANRNATPDSESRSSEEAVPGQDSNATAGTEQEGSATAGTGAEAGPTEETTDPLAEARSEIAELKEAWARERADFQNFRKRTVTERQKARQDAHITLAHDILGVMDNLDRMLSMPVENPEVKNYVTGVEMIRQGFLEALAKYNIKPLSVADSPFDPNSMEAIAMENREDLETDMVLEVYQTGYYMELESGDRHVIRPARVKVGKAGAASPQ